MSQLQESVLFDQLREGNPRAVEHLYERYRARLLRFCIRLLGDDSIAEDIVHNVFEKLQKQSATIRSADGLQNWLFTVARNEAFEELRRKKGEQIDEDILWDGELPDQEIMRREQEERIRWVIQQLHAPYREVILLREYENMSLEEIAVITNSSIAAVKSRLFHARKALVEKMKPFCE